MNLEQLLNAVPNYAKDLKLNLGNLLAQPELTKQQIWGTALTSAITARNPQLLKAIEAKAAEHLTPEAMEAARAAAAIMGMNNVYYRFLHLTENKKYVTIPAR
ncbi:MAG: alkyl hydroperoxide reductase, partial [Acidobacteria bacterium]|nr:alkyl hydroperoxide reductase [Acidobacteriota bacterium]